MRRIIPLVIFGLVLVGIGSLWVFIPRLTENDGPTSALTTATTAAEPSTSVAPESTSTTTTEPPTVRVGGAAALGIVGEPLSLNPLRTGGNAPAVEAISELWTIGLIGLDEKTHHPVAEAAAEIPTLENGGLAIGDDGTMTVRYSIAPDARWDDGSPITGLDVAFTYDLIMDAALPIRPDLRALHSLIVPGSVEASGSSIALVLERSTIRYLDLFPILVPAEQVADSDFSEDWNEATWMSAGPFRFDSWEAGRKIRFVRNDEYGKVDHLGDRLPYLDSVEIAFFNGDDALLAAFRFQTVDAALIAADPAVLEELEASPAVDLQISAGPEYEHLAFEYGPGRFGANPGSMNESVQFREFVARTLDRRATVSEVLSDRVPVLNTIVGMSWPAAASAGWAPYTVDDAVQADLLESAMIEFANETVTVSFTTSASLERTQIAGSFLQRLAAAGLSVDIELLEVGEFFKDRVLPGAFDIAEWAWRATPGPVGAVADLEARFLTLPEDGGYNFYRWGAVDSAASEVVANVQGKILELDNTLDLDKLREQLEEIDAILAEHVVVLPMFAAPNAAAVWVASFEGFDHVAAFPDTWNAALWHRTGG